MIYQNFKNRNTCFDSQLIFVYDKVEVIFFPFIVIRQSQFQHQNITLQVLLIPEFEITKGKS